MRTALVKASRRWNRISADDPDPSVRKALVTSAASWRRLRTTQEIVSLPADDPAGPDTTDHLADREQMTDALATLPPRPSHVARRGSRWRGTREGARADVLDAAGTLLASVPLTAGGGPRRSPNPAGVSVRIVDADEGVVAEVPIEQVD